MMFQNKQEKRKVMVSNAIVKHDTGDPLWFDEIRGQIDKDVAQVIYNWVLAADKGGSPITKEQILQIYGKRDATQNDNKEVRDPE